MGSGTGGDGLYAFLSPVSSELDYLITNRAFLKDKTDQSNKITVVMPTYCQARYIKEAVSSILLQTYRNFELLIVNDGSTDETSSLLSKFSDSRIRIIEKRHTGIGDTLNAGFSEGIGSYETYLASDNTLYPEALERLANVLNSYPLTDFVYSDFDLFWEDKNKTKKACNQMDMRWERQKFLNGYFVGIVYLWRRNLRLNAGPFWEKPCEDYEMFLRMSQLGGFQYLKSESLGRHRIHSESLTVQLKNKGEDWAIECSKAFYRHVLKNPYRQTFKNRIEDRDLTLMCG